MGKIITAYGGFSATDIKNRADIPAQTDMTVSGSNIDCVNIKATDVKTVLGESVTGVGALCSSANVNKWSNFGPTEWYIPATGSDITNRVKVPYMLGSFACYNHDAITAYAYFPYPTNVFSSSSAGSLVNVGFMLNFGEYDWTKLNTKCFILCEGSVVASFLTNTISGNSDMNIVLELTAPNAGLSKTYSVEVWIGSTSVWQGRLTQGSKSVTIRIAMIPQLVNVTTIDSSDNRNKAGLKLGLSGDEIVGRVWSSGTGLGFSAQYFTGSANVYADISDSSTLAYKRTETLCTTGILRATLSAYKTNNGVTSGTHAVSSLVRILPDLGLSYAVPTELLPITDDDEYFLSFDNFI